jgi:hypothetical protein
MVAGAPLRHIARLSIRGGKHILNMAARTCPVFLPVTSETKKAAKRQMAIVTPNSIKASGLGGILSRGNRPGIEAGAQYAQVSLTPILTQKL